MWYQWQDITLPMSSSGRVDNKILMLRCQEIHPICWTGMAHLKLEVISLMSASPQMVKRRFRNPCDAPRCFFTHYWCLETWIMFALWVIVYTEKQLLLREWLLKTLLPSSHLSLSFDFVSMCTICIQVHVCLGKRGHTYGG